MRSTRALARTALGLVILLLVCQQSSAGSAKADSYWFMNKDGQNLFCSGSGSWTLGLNEVAINFITLDRNGPTSGGYPGGGTVVASGKFGYASAKATSSVFAGPCLTSSGVALSATADVGGIFFGERNASATARGADPQFVVFPAVVGQKLSLDSGSSISAAVPGADEASSSFVFTAFDLTEPLASVSVVAGSGAVYAEVSFNSDPRLSFLDPDTLAPISPDDVKARLEGSTLGTDAGLGSRLSLFTYRYDLTTTPLPPEGAFFGYDAVNSASASNP